MSTVYIKQNALMARVAALRLGTKRIAIVIGHTIYLHGVSAHEFIRNKSWLCHELKHVSQYEQLGIPKFIYRYLAESMRKGYYNNAFEQEARQAETDKLLIEKYELKIL